MQVSDLKDAHKDEIGFIVGAGPSVHFINEELLKNHITIAVNGGIVKVPWCNYFLTDDVGVSTWSYFTDLLPKLPCVKLLYDKKLKDHCSHLDNVLLFKHTWWFSPPSSYNDEGLKLTKEEPIVGAITSMGSAVHFLNIMGCSPIILLGADCCYKDGYRYFWQYEGEEKPYRTKKSNVKANNNYYKSFYENKVVNYWNNMARLNPNVNIIDASDGLLSCFPKMTISEILDKYVIRSELNG